MRSNRPIAGRSYWSPFRSFATKLGRLAMSAFPSLATELRTSPEVRFVPILLQKSVEGFRTHYPALGRPSIDPVLMIRMLILGYAFGLRSERLLCREVRVNLAYRWFCGLSIEDKIPDHSVFSRTRNERFRDNDIFRRVFERVVEACISAGLVGGKEFAVDASLIAADANKQRSIPGSEWIKERDPETASRAVKEYMATLDDAAFGAATKVTPKFVSPSDPTAQWTGAMRGPAFFAYSDNYLIDVKVGIIMDGVARHPPGGCRRVEDDDRADTGALRYQA
jgi:transposase